MLHYRLPQMLIYWRVNSALAPASLYRLRPCRRPLFGRLWPRLKPKSRILRQILGFNLMFPNYTNSH